MKKIAFYLPQFHSIPENDVWWGKGFTEWSNVKKAKSQFRRHYQPEIPYNNNYYCLLDSRVQEKQSEMALKYGIDGFCYYHYWFSGKKLLEKPMENMLCNKKIEIPFCICWANESWARTWDGQEHKILIQQNYDECKIAWKEHFDYLLPFFNDSRYIIDNNRPLIIIYKPHLIRKCREMLEYWNMLAAEAGFDGLYVGCQHPSSFNYNYRDMGIDFGIEFEPLYSLAEEKKETDSIKKKILYSVLHPHWLLWKMKRRLLHYPNVHDYDLIWNRIISRIPVDKSVAAGAFPSWDNTPRKGRDADVFFQADPIKFRKYFQQRVQKAQKCYGVQYLFINAWNEWAEGAHLEPDDKNGYGYLEALKGN